MEKDVQTLKRQNNNLDSDRHERDKTLNHLRTRVAVLEQEIKDKQQVGIILLFVFYPEPFQFCDMLSIWVISL